MTIKRLYQFLHPTKDEGTYLFRNVGTPFLLVIFINSISSPERKEFEIWLEPGWTKSELLEKLDAIASPFEGWIANSGIVLIDTLIKKE